MEVPGNELPEMPSPAEAEQPAITRLRPGSELHTLVLKKLTDRISYSERKMTDFYSRWRMSEKRMQAYIDLPDYEKQLKALAQKNGEPPPLVSITVPYSFATIWTIVTYLAHTFTGRKPIFQVASHKAEGVDGAEKMEIVLQYNADHIRLIRHLFQFFMDGEVYGVGIIRTAWVQEWKKRTRIVSIAPDGNVGEGIAPMRARLREKTLTYEGNSCAAVDPFMFFPDPRVPMSEVNRRGEFVFWRTFEGEFSLKRAQANGEIMWVEAASKSLPRANFTDTEPGQSARNLLTHGDSVAGARDSQDHRALPFYQVDQGTVEIIPSEWGLGDSLDVEKWMFTILNKSQIVQAEPLDLDHDMHPVAVIEPYSVGYAFGQPGMNDMLGPLQDTVSWFINSHMHNVRNTLYNEFIVNPSAIEMQDLAKPGPGKIIRLKPAAYGTDLRTVIQQLNTVDVTQGHVRDMEQFIRMSDQVAAVNDNLRGIQTVGGRKTATEVRTSGEAGASRLAAHAKLISSQGIVDLTEQMSLNLQQNLSIDFYLQIVGADGVQKPLKISPEDIVGDFYYPIHDGTLPIDKVALLDIWREILKGVAQDPQLRMGYDINKIFEFVAELGGAKNISSFRLQTPEQMAQAAGGMMPLPGMEGMGNDPQAIMQALAAGGRL